MAKNPDTYTGVMCLMPAPPALAREILQSVTPGGYLMLAPGPYNNTGPLPGPAGPAGPPGPHIVCGHNGPVPTGESYDQTMRALQNDCGGGGAPALKYAAAATRGLIETVGPPRNGYTDYLHQQVCGIAIRIIEDKLGRSGMVQHPEQIATAVFRLLETATPEELRDGVPAARFAGVIALDGPLRLHRAGGTLRHCVGRAALQGGIKDPAALVAVLHALTPVVGVDPSLLAERMPHVSQALTHAIEVFTGRPAESHAREFQVSTDSFLGTHLVDATHGPYSAANSLARAFNLTAGPWQDGGATLSALTQLAEQGVELGAPVYINDYELDALAALLTLTIHGRVWPAKIVIQMCPVVYRMASRAGLDIRMVVRVALDTLRAYAVAKGIDTGDVAVPLDIDWTSEHANNYWAVGALVIKQLGWMLATGVGVGAPDDLADQLRLFDYYYTAHDEHTPNPEHLAGIAAAVQLPGPVAQRYAATVAEFALMRPDAAEESERILTLIGQERLAHVDGTPSPGDDA